MAAPAEEAAFPRGGGDSLSVGERKRLRQEAIKEANADFLAGDYSTKKRQKRAQGQGDESDVATFVKHAEDAQKVKYIELLKFKNLSVGSRVWGAIVSIQPRELGISLPDGLRAFVPIEEASDVVAKALSDLQGASNASSPVPSLQALFHIGQLVPGVIIKLEEASQGTKGGIKKRVILSLRLEKLNKGISKSTLQAGMSIPACVKDVEDHGYTSTLGIKGATAFVSREEVGSHGQELIPGRLLNISITDATDKRLLKASAIPDKVNNTVLKDEFGPTIGTLPPGALVNTRLENVLDDGLQLSFLTYFSGTVDIFHIPQASSSHGDWKTHYSKGQKMRARIIYVDPSSKQISLSLLPHLLACTSPNLPDPGTLIEDAVVSRVDAAIGVILKLPEGSSAFCHISDVSDGRVEKLDKVLKVGQCEKVRVIGSRLMDNLAVVSLKPSAIEQYLVAGLEPGQIVKGEVILVDDNGMLVRISKTTNAFVANEHISDLGEKQGKLKYKAGSKVAGRVLNVDPVKRKTTLSLQKSLLTSKTKPITSLEDVPVGSRVHGIVNGFASYGMFVQFYGNVRGLVHTSEMDLEPNTSPSSLFLKGQVVKVKVVSYDAANKRIHLSLKSKKSRALSSAHVQLEPGQLLNGHVTQIKQDEDNDIESYTLTLVRDGESMGTGLLDVAHLADHPSAVETLQEIIQVGSVLEEIMVLNQLKGSQTFVVTRKWSLISNAEPSPSSVEDVKEGQILSGFVTNIVADAVFVRFLAGLTGRSGLAGLADKFVSNPSGLFFKGQSVRAKVLQVNKERGTFALDLKSSSVGDSRPGFLSSLFKDLENAYAIKSKIEEESGEPLSDWAKLLIGISTKVSVHEHKDYGVICDLEQDPNLVGLAPLHQVPEGLDVGDKVTGKILDTNKVSGIVDLTLKSELAGKVTRKKTRKAEHPVLPDVGSTVRAEVQIVREEYTVVTLPQFGNIPGFVGLLDYNERQGKDRHALFSKLDFAVKYLPSDQTGGRLILAPIAEKIVSKKQQQSNQQSGISLLQPGTIVSGKISDVEPLYLVVAVTTGQIGQVHISEVGDSTSPALNPLQRYRPGQTVQAMVLHPGQKFPKSTPTSNKKPNRVELTLRLPDPNSKVDENKSLRSEFSDLRAGQERTGFVSMVTPDYLLVSFAYNLTGRVSILDAFPDPDKLANIASHFKLGDLLRCKVLKCEEKSKRLDLAAIVPNSPILYHSLHAQEAPSNSKVMGRISSISGSGLRLHIGPGILGIVPLTEIYDSWVKNSLEAIKEGQFVRAIVLRVEVQKGLEIGQEGSGQQQKRKRSNSEGDKNLDSQAKILLSLKPSLGGAVSGLPKSLKTLNYPENPQELKTGIEVCGYVKVASKAGVFVALGPGMDARVKLANLANHFVEDPAKDFPIGKCVQGKLISIRPKLEMSLRPEKQESSGFEGLAAGQVVKGKVMRVKDFGIFVQLDDKPVTGLVHKSQVHDKFVKDTSGLFTRLQPVRAIILEVDAPSKTLKLSLRPSLVQETDAGADEGDGLEPDAQEEVGPDADNELLEALSEESEDASDWRSASQNEGGNTEDESEEADSMSEGEPSGKKARKEPRLGTESDLDVQLTSDSEEKDSSSDTSKRDKSIKRDSLPSYEVVGVGWGSEPSLPPKVSDDLFSRGDPEELKAGASLSKRQLKKRKQEEEEAIRQAEMLRLQDGSPQSAAEFERALIGSPNSSVLWIQYMAFLVSLGELDKARALAEQAIQRIDYRNEDEKFNIWVAWLNLELQYGNPDGDDAMRLFQRALSLTNQKKLYMALLNILQQAGQESLLQQTFKAVSRKYATSAKFWLKQLNHAQQQDDAAFVGAVLNRAIKATPQRKHVKILRQAALQDFKLGSPERGRSTFEGLLRNYPKRMDLWSIYLDQEIKQGDQARIRSLFERAISIDIPAKRIKFLFKRYLEFEKKQGTQDSIQHVKDAAQKYVAGKIAA